MKTKHILSLILTIILLVSTLSLLISYAQNSPKPKDPVYVGIAFGGNSTEQAKLLIDKTKGYTNLFILDSGINLISANQSAVQEICDYATKSGLNIIVNLGTYNRSDWSWKLQFYNSSKEKYGSKFLGVYYDDEPCGIPLDWNWTKQFTEDSPLFYGENRLSLVDVHYKLQMASITGTQPENYSLEAQWYHDLIVQNRGHISLNQNNITTMTSDYALYWYGYLGGYDTMLTQVGWNVSENSQISLIRGAATMQNRDWGAIITWKYSEPPYLDTGENVYNQMKTAYNAGAKYIMVFDLIFDKFNGTNSQYDTMTDAHFQALEQFWNQVATKTPPTSAHAQAALVLPHDYGSGLRSSTDKIWGFWGPDDKSELIWNNMQTLLGKYGLGLDIIYEDSAFPTEGNYSRIYFWNQTINFG